MKVLTAVLKWVKHDPETRKDDLPALLSCIRMGLLPLQALERLPQEPLLDRAIRDFPECAAQVEEGKRSVK